jgi:type IV pilus assembly protein PilP
MIIVSSSLRNVLLGVTLLMIALGGCGERSEPESAREPSAVRKKITVAKEPSSQFAKPEVAKPEVAKTEVAKTEVAKPSERQGDKGPTPPTQRRAVPEVKKQVKKPEPKATEKKAVTAPPSPLPADKVKPPPDEEKAPAPPVESEEPLLAKGMKEKTAISYDPKGKLDPFKPLFEIEAERRAEAKKRRKKKERAPLTPLQRLDLSQLKLVGIILSPKQNKAMVEEATGKAYIITKGTYIGQNFGRVKEILIDRVVVEEEAEDFVTGEVKFQTRELKLQKRVGD